LADSECFHSLKKGQARLGVVGLCLTPGTYLPEDLAIVKHVDKSRLYPDKGQAVNQPFSRSVEMSIQACFSYQSWHYRLGMVQEFIEKMVLGCRFLLIISLSDRKKPLA
jgi:hypothetical protein